MEGYCVSNTGVSLHMREMGDAAMQCWDWEHLTAWREGTRKYAQKEHYEAFFRLAAKLEPSLQHTHWPDGPDFGFVSRRWPAKRGTNGLFQQYKTLQHRVRNGGKSRFRSRGWWRPQQATVQPVLDGGPLQRVCRSTASWPQLGQASFGCRACVLFLIRDFLGGASVSAARPGPFKTAMSGLLALGQTRAAQRCRGSEGSFAVFLSAGRSRKLVRVISVVWTVDESRLASSLLSDRSLIFPDDAGNHCWHAARIYMRSRLKAPEAVCERWGSLMHMLWNSIGGWQAHRIVSRLFMREAAALERPAARRKIKEEIAAELRRGSNWNPYRWRELHRGRYDKPASGTSDAEDSEGDDEELTAVRLGIRENPRTKHWWRDKSSPAFLLQGAQDAVRKALIPDSKRMALQPLPLHAKDVGATPSVHVQHMAEWLQSEDAETWRRERVAMFRDLRKT